jgi:uncharacterized protein (DUF58 family)
MSQTIDRALLEKFGNLELLAKQVVEGFITGLHKSPFHGFSVEFVEHRLYNSGESTRHIDWKLFARTDKHFVKRYEEETNLRCWLILDHSSSMNFPEDAKTRNIFNKSQFSAYAAASLIELLKKQRDAVGLGIFSDNLEELTPAKLSNTHLNMLYSILSDILSKPIPNKNSSIVESIHQIAERIHQRSLVVIFSDLMDSQQNLDELFMALQHLKHNKHEPILFHVVDKEKELDFNFENRPTQFIDMETGDEVKLHPSAVKQFYQTQMQEFDKEIKLKAGQYAIDYIEADINKGLHQVLQGYLVKRNKMIKGAR